MSRMSKVCFVVDQAFAEQVRRLPDQRNQLVALMAYFERPADLSGPLEDLRGQGRTSHPAPERAADHLAVAENGPLPLSDALSDDLSDAPDTVETHIDSLERTPGEGVRSQESLEAPPRDESIAHGGESHGGHDMPSASVDGVLERQLLPSAAGEDRPGFAAGEVVSERWIPYGRVKPVSDVVPEAGSGPAREAKAEAFVFGTDEQGARRVVQPAVPGELTRVGYAWQWHTSATDPAGQLHLIRRIRLRPEGASPTELDRLKAGTEDALKRLVNEPGYRVPVPGLVTGEGPVLRVLVEFVDGPHAPADAVVRVRSGVPGRWDMVQNAWYTGVPAEIYVHEILHGLGVLNDQAAPQALLVPGGRPEPHSDPNASSIMGPFTAETSQRSVVLLDDHLRQIAEVFAPYGHPPRPVEQADSTPAPAPLDANLAQSVEDDRMDTWPAVDYQLIHPNDHATIAESLPNETLYRFSGADPEDVFTEGFLSDGVLRLATVKNWAWDNPQDAQFVATSRNRELWHGMKRYRYEIDPSRNSDPIGVDVHATLESQQHRVRQPQEQEVAFTGQVDPEAVVSVYDKLNNRTGVWNAAAESVDWTSGDNQPARDRLVVPTGPLPAGSRESGVNPVLEGWVLGRAVTLDGPRAVKKGEPAVAAVDAQQDSAVPAGGGAVRVVGDYPFRSAPFSYGVGGGEIQVTEDWTVPAEGWRRYGADFVHVGAGALLRGDSGWIGRVANAEQVRDRVVAERSGAPSYTVGGWAGRVRLVPDRAGSGHPVLEVPGAVVVTEWEGKDVPPADRAEVRATVDRRQGDQQEGTLAAIVDHWGSVEEFERRIGAFHFHDPAALTAARAAVGRMREVLRAAFPEAGTEEIADAFFADDATSAGQVGRVPGASAARLDGLLATGNVREVMTAYMNALDSKALFRGTTRSLSFARLVHSLLLPEPSVSSVSSVSSAYDPVDLDARMEQAARLGLDADALRSYGDYLRGSRRASLQELVEDYPGPARRRNMFGADPFAPGNLAAFDSAARGNDPLEVMHSLNTRVPRSERDRAIGTRKTTPRHYQELGVPLSPDELSFLARNEPTLPMEGFDLREIPLATLRFDPVTGTPDLDGLLARPEVYFVEVHRAGEADPVRLEAGDVPNSADRPVERVVAVVRQDTTVARPRAHDLRTGESGPQLPLSWVEGTAYHDLDTASDWYREWHGRRNMPVVAGLSGTAMQTLRAFQWLKVPGTSVMDFRNALLGWMLPGRDHSLFEIVRGFHLADAATPEEEHASLTGPEALYAVSTLVPPSLRASAPRSASPEKTAGAEQTAQPTQATAETTTTSTPPPRQQDTAHRETSGRNPVSSSTAGELDPERATGVPGTVAFLDPAPRSVAEGGSGAVTVLGDDASPARTPADSVPAEDAAARAERAGAERRADATPVERPTRVAAAPDGPAAAEADLPADKPLQYRDRLMLARRVWERPVPEESAHLERMLLRAGPGARALVVNTHPDKRVWAVNNSGRVQWLTHGTVEVVEPPQSASEGAEVFSIDLDAKATLLHGVPRLQRAGSGGARFCELTFGVDLKHIM